MEEGKLTRINADIEPLKEEWLPWFDKSEDLVICRYLLLSPDEQVKLWLKKEYCRLFPKIVKRMISPEGKDVFSEVQRGVFLARSLNALNKYNWTCQTYPNVEANVVPSIPASLLSFRCNDTNNQCDRDNLETEFDINKDCLLRTDIASCILLALSMSDKEEALRNVMALSYKGKYRLMNLEQHLGLLLTKKNITRKWIKENKLDSFVDCEWDSSIAELYLNLPDNRFIDKLLISNHWRLPHPLKDADSANIYSTDSFLVFLEYVLQYSEISKVNNNREILDFLLNVRHLPSEFLLQPEVLIYLKLLHRSINRSIKDLHIITNGSSHNSNSHLSEETRREHFHWYV